MELLPGINYPVYRLAIILVEILVALFLYLLFSRTRLGMQVRAGVSNWEMVAALGVNIRMLYTLIFGLGTLLLLDEATEGLAPIVCEEIWNGLTILKKQGLSILVVDKNIDALLRISNRACIMEKGMIDWNDEHPFAVFTDEIKMRYLGV